MHIRLHALPLVSALQVRISQENTLNTTTQQFMTGKITGCALKQGSKTRSSLRQSNLQVQNEAALMSCRIRAVEHRCMAGLADAHPCLKDRILQNYTRIENAHKVRLLFVHLRVKRRYFGIPSGEPVKNYLFNMCSPCFLFACKKDSAMSRSKLFNHQAVKLLNKL